MRISHSISQLIVLTGDLKYIDNMCTTRYHITHIIYMYLDIHKSPDLEENILAICLDMHIYYMLLNILISDINIVCISRY